MWLIYKVRRFGHFVEVARAAAEVIHDTHQHNYA